MNSERIFNNLVKSFVILIHRILKMQYMINDVLICTKIGHNMISKVLYFC